MFLLGLWRRFHFMIEAVISRVTVTVRAPSQKSNTPHSPRKVMIRVHRITPRVKARPHRPLHTSHSPRSCHPYERLHGQDLQPKVAHHLPPDTRAATPHFYPYIRWLAAEWRSTQPATSRAPEGEKKLSLLVFLLSHFPGNLLFGSHFFPEKRKKCLSKALRLRVLMSSTQRMRFFPCTTMRPPSLFMRTGMAPTNGLSSPRLSNMNSGPMPMSPC